MEGERVEGEGMEGREWRGGDGGGGDGREGMEGEGYEVVRVGRLPITRTIFALMRRYSLAVSLPCSHFHLIV